MARDANDIARENGVDGVRLAWDAAHSSPARVTDCDNILGLFAKEVAKVHAGEERNAKLLYLIATSRLFAKPMHVAVKGPSAGGKSELRNQVLKFMPPGASSLSPRCRSGRCSFVPMTCRTRFSAWPRRPEPRNRNFKTTCFAS